VPARAGRPGAHRAGPQRRRCRGPEAGGDGKRCDGQRRGRHLGASRPQGTGRKAAGGRLRDGLLVALVPAQAAAGHPEDRPLVHRRDGAGKQAHVHRAGHHRAGEHAGAGNDGGGGRRRRPGAAAAGNGSHLRPGIPVEPPGSGGPGGSADHASPAPPL
ncbi:MAG: diguanylate cyclase/phosphodiesterase (GGDEF & EAL domains) with PAS/PAC sensor(s), partial [uncultured Gemmatimonadetes bacterium]